MSMYTAAVRVVKEQNGGYIKAHLSKHVVRGCCTFSQYRTMHTNRYIASLGPTLALTTLGDLVVTR
jgi:hypothetical protein